MAVRLGKKVFATYVIGDDRAPVLTNIDPDEGDVGNPDPGGPGGSDPGGGDIGSPTGGGVVTTTLPTITRKNHNQDIYLAKGAALSITYVADGDCTMLLKWGYDDMIVSYTDDGREMTVTWTCPANEPSDSTPIGVEVFVYGSDSETDYSNQYTVLWDILHIGKTSADIIDFNTGNSIRTNFSRMNSPNNTLIVPDATYTKDDDEISLRNYAFPFSSSPVNGSFTESGTGTNKTYTVTENSVIISRTPLGSILDRNGKIGGVYIEGDIPEYSGYNVYGLGGRAVAIKIKGFAVKNSGRGQIGIVKGEKCAIDGCENIQDMGFRELNTFWQGDGAANYIIASLDSNIEYGGGMANERFGNLMAFTLNNPARRSKNARNWSTMACVQIESQRRCQDFSFYGATDCKVSNCIAVDDYLYADGIRQGGAGNSISNFNFINTNGANLSTTLSRCMSFNTIKSFWWNNNNSSDDADKSLLRHCVTAIKRAHPFGSDTSAFWRNHFDIENTIMGNYEKFPGLSAFFDFGNDDVTGLLLVYPGWNYGLIDSIMGGNSFPNFDGIGIVNPPEEINEYITALVDYYNYASVEAAGVKYWTRTEDGGSARTAGLGPVDFWCAEGRYGKFEADNDNTVYNGSSASVPYVNWLQRSPWYERQQLRRTYNHTTTDGTVFSGDAGINEAGVHPVDYFHRRGVSPFAPTNCPYIEDIYHKVLSNGTVRLWWRPVCPKYRGTITGLDFYVDGVRVAENQNKRYTRFDIENLNSGTRSIWIVCKDTTYGDSGHSRKIKAVIP